MNRPHVTINTAITADGKIDSALRQGAAISSGVDMVRMDRLRAASDAILVGGQTLIYQDPRLTIKSAALREERTGRGLPPNPVKVGVVSAANISPDSRFMSFGPARRLIYTTPRSSSKQISALQAAGAEVFIMGQIRVDLTAVLDSLYNMGIRSLFVEGGGTIIAEFFRLLLVDELILYIAPKIFGGASAPTLVDGPGFLPEEAPQLKLVSVEKLDSEGGILVHYNIEPI
jgi:2,5-diamino-6-(ribosylamino)-4(3H)-pyrimidinone 5'-phosphate reductase